MAASFHNWISITKSLSSTNYACCCRNNTFAASSSSNSNSNSNSNSLLLIINRIIDNRSSGSTSSWVDPHQLLLLQSKNNKKRKRNRKRNRNRRGELTVRTAATTIDDDQDDLGLSRRVIRDSSNLVPFGGQTSTSTSTSSSSTRLSSDQYGLSSSVARSQSQFGVDVVGISAARDEPSIQPIIVPPPSSSPNNNNTLSPPNYNSPPPPPPPPPQQQQQNEGGGGGGGDNYKMIDRGINVAFVLALSTFAITKLLTIDSDYWHGWTLYEIVRYAPQHNWSAYEEALKTDPVLAKMMISGIVYSLGDWIAQCYEGKPLLEFDRSRMFRSGIVGFSLHGSLSHYYYHFCEALFPFQDWWVVPAKVAFDQTIWSAIWNSVYYVVVGFLRFESPVVIFSELKATFLPMLTAGWKLWPFAHLITYGVIPVEQRLLWVDCVELIWVTILSTYSNEKSEGRQSEAINEKQ